MATFPTTSYTNGVTAQADLVNKSIAAGYTPNSALGQTDTLTAIQANLMTGLPATVTFGNYATGQSIGGGLTTASFLVKAISAITDNTFTDIVTVTVPNIKAAAVIRVHLLGALGAGGAIGAGEAMAGISYDVGVVRTAGVNAVTVASSAYGSTTSTAVAGATTATVTAQVSAIAGAVGAVNTFTIQIKVAKGGAGSDNHTAVAFVEVINQFAGGVTVA